MATITKKDLIQSIAEKNNMNPVEVKDIVQAILDEIVTQLGNRNRIEFRDFAVFDIRIRSARIGHNPRTLEKVQVPSRAVVEFKMGKRMKEAVNRLSPETFKPKPTAPPPPTETSSSPAPPPSY